MRALAAVLTALALAGCVIRARTVHITASPATMLTIKATGIPLSTP
jgi:outer membrane murein-binding lipoprotein Lpp